MEQKTERPVQEDLSPSPVQEDLDLAVMVTEARKQLANLFTEENLGLWYMCYPTPPETATPVTPSASKNFATTNVLGAMPTTMRDFAFPVIESIGKAIDGLFCTGHPLGTTGTGVSHLHNTSFWSTFLDELQFELSEGLVTQSRPKTEAEVRYKLLAPLLRRIAHSASQMPVPNDCDIGKIVYTYEVNTEDRESQRGRRPQVDFALSAHVDSDNAIYCVPVEAKKTVEKRDMAQLAEYQAALSCGVIKRYMSVGLLLDEHRVLFVFSPWSYSDGVPVPIMLVSPVMNWRQGPVVSRATCTSLCLVPTTLIVPRHPINAEVAATVFTGMWGYIREQAMEFDKKKATIPPPQELTSYDLAEAIEDLRADVLQMKQALATGIHLRLPCATQDYTG